MKGLLLAALGGLSVAALITAFDADAAPAAKFRLCTGKQDLNYFKAGHILKKFSTDVDVEVVATKGSMHNLDMLLEGGCDGAFVQSDAMMVYSDRNAQAISALERAGVLYREQANLLCNRASGISHIYDLTPKSVVAVGPEGAGNRTTWDAFVLANKKRYGAVRTDPRDGMRALGAVSDGTLVQCMLSVSALNSSFIRNDAQQAGDRVVLAGTDDGDLEKAKDARGNLVYSFGEIPTGTYPRIQPQGRVYGTKAVGVLEVDALFVTSLSWVSANETANERLLRAFGAAKPDIKEMVKPR